MRESLIRARDTVIEKTETAVRFGKTAVSATAAGVLFDAAVTTNTWPEVAVLGTGIVLGGATHRVIAGGDRLTVQGLGSRTMLGLIRSLGASGAVLCATAEGPKEAVGFLAAYTAANILVNPASAVFKQVQKTSGEMRINGKNRKAAAERKSTEEYGPFKYKK